MGDWAKDIAYTDCLAGPWEARGEKLEDTSFSRAINVLRAAKALLGLRGKRPTFRCLLVERDPESFRQLSEFGRSISDLEVTTAPWDFSSHVNDVANFAKKRKGSFPFLFIDPTGWELASVSLIKPILVLEPGEVLINLMTSWVKRFLADESKNFESLLGPNVGKLRQLTGDEQEEELVRCYAESIRRAGRFNFVCTLPILKADADMFHFWMVYGTRHPKGVEVFKSAEKAVVPFMHETRAEAQQRKRFRRSGGQFNLLEAEATYVERRLSRLQEKNRELAQADLEKMLRNSDSVPFDGVQGAWARAMQFSLVTESDLKEWIQGWRETGNLEVLNMRTPWHVPKRGMGNILRWVSKDDRTR